MPSRPPSPAPIVVMGVSGCGKSTLARSLAERLGWVFAEGDTYHPPRNVEKMASGVPLTDADRAGWLSSLVDVLRQHPDGVVLSCSSLKRVYRDQLREAHPDLRFVFLDISLASASARVSARSGVHFFNPALVRNQFDVLEPPAAEAGVLTLDADLPGERLCDEALAWALQDTVPLA